MARDTVSGIYLDILSDIESSIGPSIRPSTKVCIIRMAKSFFFTYFYIVFFLEIGMYNTFYSNSIIAYCFFVRLRSTLYNKLFETM